MGLQRTPMTWTLYAATGAWASFVYLTGPISPVLAADLGIPEASAGLVGTALAAGGATAAVSAKIARRIGRAAAIRLGLGIVALATACLGLTHFLSPGWPTFIAVLLLVYVAAIGGGTTLNVSTAELSDLHPKHSAAAITEANAAAAWTGLLSPLLLGAVLAAGLGWWVGFYLCLIVVLSALTGFILAHRSQGGGEPEQHPHHTMPAVDELYEQPPSAVTQALIQDTTPDPSGTLPAPRGLPRRYWVAMAALFAAAGAEFAINFWGSPLIQSTTGASASSATAVMSASVAGLAVGRTVGTRVTNALGSHRTLIGGFLLALVGFVILWTAGVLPIAVVGLFVVGLGLATLFPLVIDRGIALSEGQPDLAMARASLVLGSAIGGAPFLLGFLGAIVSVQTAMLLVPVLLGIGIVGVLGSQPGARTAVASG